MKRIASLFLVLSLAASAALAADNPRVKMETTQGDFVMELYPDKAPKTVANFLEYVKSGHYDGTLFHRVIGNFMIQGGGFTEQMQQKPTRDPIPNEADNGLRNTIGTVAMARTNDPHSATSQFFINVVNNDFLDFREKTARAWGYAVFGRVVSGMDAVERIKSVPTTSKGPFQDVPREPVIIKRASIVEAAQEKK